MTAASWAIYVLNAPEAVIQYPPLALVTAFFGASPGLFRHWRNFVVLAALLALAIPEIEQSVLSSQYLDRRILDRATPKAAVHVWQKGRHSAIGTFDWCVTADLTLANLKRLYPSLQE